MKKTLTMAAALLFAGQFVNAQTQKGKQNLGIYVGFTNSNISNVSYNNTYSMPYGQEGKATNLNIGPSYGYFINDGLELGGTLSFGHSDQTSTSSSFVQISSGNFTPVTTTTKFKSNVYGLTAYLRKYVLFQNKIGFRTGPYATYQRGKNENTNAGGSVNSTRANIYSVGGNFDVVYYPLTNFGLSASIANISYTNSKSTGATPSKTENFTFNFINSGLLLSLFYTFGK